MELSFFNSLTFFGVSLALISILVFLLLLIAIPGFFIWLSLALIGKRRPLLKCGFANLIAFISSAFLTFILSFSPLIILSPLIFVLIYLWVFKELLDLGWSDAILAMVISVAFVMLLSAIFSLSFSAFFKPAWLPNFRF